MLGELHRCHLGYARKIARGGREKATLYVLGAVKKNAGWNLDSGLEIKHDPCWRVVACVFLPTRPSVNTAVH